MHRKALLCIALAVLLLWALSPAAAAEQTEISTVVPSAHTVTVRCGPHGGVVVDGVLHLSTATFSVPRHAAFTCLILPADGYTLEGVSGGSGSGLIPTDAGVTIPRITSDTSLTVAFRAEEEGEPPLPDVITVPVKGREHGIAASARVAGDTANVLVEQARLEELLTTDTGTETVTVDVSGLDTDIRTVVLPTAVIDSVAERIASAESALAGLAVDFGHAAVTFDEAALRAVSAQAQGETVALHVEEVAADALSDAQRKTLTDAPEDTRILYVTFKSGDTPITEFGGGSAVLRLPYTPKSGEDTDSITVWYLAGDGTLEQLPCRYERGQVCFTVYHFSNYLIRPGTLAHCAVCAWLGRDVSPWCRLLPVLLALAALTTLTGILLRRRGKRRSGSAPGASV